MCLGNRGDGGRVEIKEKRWEYFGDDMYVWRAYRNPDGSSSTLYDKIRWYNRWFIKLKNRKKPKDTRTAQQIMDDAGIISASSPDLNITVVNTRLIQKMKQEGRWKE